MYFTLIVRNIISIGVFSIFPATTAWSQTPAEFYKDKTVDLMVGYSAGGGYDVYARIIARHIGKHIPGHPTVVVKNMEGAGSLRLANSLYNSLPKDGTVFGVGLSVLVLAADGRIERDYTFIVA